MKKAKLIALVLACLLMSLSPAGCAANVDSRGANAPISIVEVTAQELQKPLYGQEDASLSAASDGANDFAFALSAALAANIDQDNFICSPYAVWMPLAALANATDAQNKAALLSALHIPGMSQADLNSAVSRMLYGLTGQHDRELALEYGWDYHPPLSIANAVFVGNDVTLNQDFAQLFMDGYRGNAINVDFRSQEAARAVNQWASENTEGLITHIIGEFDPETVAAMACAIHYSDKWTREFNPEKTVEDAFHAPAGDVSAFFMLREGDNQVYYEDDRVQAMPLSFVTGGGMYILLPKDGDAAGLLATMTSAYFEEIQRDSILATGKLLLPRFSVESDTMQLDDALAALGVPLFDWQSAPLGGLLEEDIPVWLSGVAHKATIQVDEKGATATAVTIMPGPAAGMPVPTEPFEMNCNRPFVFILCGTVYGGGAQVLFTGVVNQP